MSFLTYKYAFTLVEDSEIEDILSIYNSNQYFIENHLHISHVEMDWLIHELDEMKELGFDSYKIVDNRTGKILGIIEFKPSTDTYLSLFLIHISYQGKGIGIDIYKSFEESMKARNCNYIHLDVVTEDNDKTIKFWLKCGFKKVQDIELTWNERKLPAIRMRKEI